MRKPILFLLAPALGLALASCDKPAAPTPARHVEGEQTSPRPANTLAPFPTPEKSGTIRGLIVPDPARTRTISLRHPGIVIGMMHRVGDNVHAGDVLAEVDSPEIARTVFELRKLEAEYVRAKGAQGVAESRLDTQKARAEARAVEAGIAEEQMMTLRLAGEPATSRNLIDIRLQAIALRAEAVELVSGLEALRREITEARDRADAILRSAAALRAFIGPHMEPPGSQGRWGADLERPNVVRLDSPIDGQIVGVPAHIGDGLPAGAGVVRITDMSGVAIQPTAEDEARLLELAGKPVRVLDGEGHPLGEGTVSVEWMGDEGGRRAWVPLANPASTLKLGGRVVIEPAPAPPVAPVG